MSKPNPPEVRDDIVTEACAWFVEFNENPRDQSMREAFNRWLRRSPEHVHAYLQVSAHWEEGTPRPNLPVESVDELVVLARTESNVVRLTRPAGIQRARAPEIRQNRRAIGRFPLVASILLSLTAGTVVWQSFFEAIYSTETGEQRSLTLSDGSTVELNSRSRIRVHYSPRERHIDLLEGQALFQVAKDKSRPFVVQSQNVRVRAVGTQFDVYRKESGTTVTVVEGKVAVIPAPPDVSSSERAIQPSEPSSRPRGASATFLAAGEQLTFGPEATATTTSPQPLPANIAAATAWTQRRLIFNGAPLSEVVAEFNRYSQRPLIITDPTIAATRISGSFSSSDPGAVLRFLREVGACDVRETPTAIEISRK